MTTATMGKSDTRFLGLPKNRTGLFAADTIHEVKSTRNHLITVPALSPQFRHNGLTNLLLASSEQNHHQLQQYRLSRNEIQQYYPIDKNHSSAIDSSNDSRLTLNRIRNGFRPSTVRHQNSRLITAIPQRNNRNHHHENKDSPPKSAVMQSHTSAKLRSEIDHINNKLLKHRESNNILRFQNSRELDDSPNSASSYSTLNHDSSTSSTRTADRIHQRFSSTITNNTANARPTLPAVNDTSNQTTQNLSVITESLPTLPNTAIDDNQEETTDYQPTHAYQIPQQSNVGNESIFLTDPLPTSSIKTRSAKYDRHFNDLKSVSCPFYVMYFTNLTMQQRQNKPNNTNDKETDRTTLAMPSAILTTSTAHPKRQSTRRQVNSPITISTSSKIDANDRMTNSTSIPYNKRLLTKISTIENEHLRHILRTSTWNHE